MRKMPKRIARSEAHFFAVEMIRQGLEGGALCSFEEDAQLRIEQALGPIIARLDKGAVTEEPNEAYQWKSKRGM